MVDESITYEPFNDEGSVANDDPCESSLGSEGEVPEHPSHFPESLGLERATRCCWTQG